MMKKWFMNSYEKRLRAGWRILMFLIAASIISRLLIKVIKPIFSGMPDVPVMSWVSRGFIVIIGATLLVWTFRRFIDRKSFVSLGLKFNGRAVLDMLVGFILSGLMVGTVFIILVQFNLLQVQEISWNGNGMVPALELFLWFFGIGVAVGWSEELVFRGYLLQNLSEGIGLIWAVIIMSILYGAMHMGNPNSTWLSGLIIVGFGFLRIFGWLRTNQLWLTMGMHAGWDFIQGPIFGFGVSGYGSSSLIKHSLSGPDWITGGSFGPEAGVVVVPALLFALIVMFIWTVKRENTVWFQLRGKVKL